MTYTESIESIKQGLIEFFAEPNPNIQTTQSTVTVPAQTGNMVMFIYLIEDIFSEVKKITAIRARSIKNKAGDSLIDEYAMTDDELSIFSTFCKNASTDLYSIFVAFCKAITPGYLHDVGEIIPLFDISTIYHPDDIIKYDNKIYKCISTSAYLTPVSELGSTIWENLPDWIDTKEKIIFVIDYDPEYKINVINFIESKIKNCLICYVLGEWYSMVGLKDMELSYKSNYVDQKDSIMGNLFNLKPTRRAYSEFPT